MEDLRTRQRALAQQTILDACAALVTEHRHLDFAMKDVADRAGVSLRTVYNHFATREDLLDALGTMFNDHMAARGGPDATDLETGGIDLVTAIRVNLQLFEELDGVSEAFAQLPLTDVGRDEERRVRTERIVEHIVGMMPSVPRDQAVAIATVLRHLLSHRSWFWLTREYGLTVDQVSDVVTWAATTLVDAAEGGDVPTPQEES